jgi:hypothetical protein
MTQTTTAREAKKLRQPSDHARLPAKLSLCLLLSVGLLPAVASANSLESCHTDAWLACGAAVKEALAKETDPKKVVELSVLWADAFTRRLGQLEAAGLIMRSKSDWELFADAVWDEISPVEIAKEKAKEAILERYLKKFAVLLQRAQPIIAGLKAFFTPSQSATDLDELEMLNRQLQGLINERLAPYLKPDLDSLVRESAERAKPAFVTP